MDIRCLTSKNTQEIIDLESDSAPGKPYYVPYSVSDLEEIFGDPNHCKAFGLYEEDKLVAWSSYRKNKDNQYEICSLVTSKDYRGKGFGKILLEHAKNELLKDHREASIYLTVSPQNIVALLLYLKSNFVIYDFKKDYYGPGSDRLFLRYAGS